MRIVNAKCGSVIPIGRLGENEAVQVIFDVASWKTTYGDGNFNLLNKRNGDENAYPCDVIEDNGKLLWNINSADVANVGYGQCEIVYIVGDTIAKSEIYTTIVGKALTGGGDVPEPWEDWVERVLQAGVDAQDAKYVWENMTAVGVESSEVFAEYENGVLTVGVPMCGGTYDHGQLSNRDANNQHPINAITGLQSALDGKQPIGNYATTQDVSDLADIVDTKADASDIPSLDGYATEQWVENKGYLTEHQSLDGYATEEYVNGHHDSTKQDVISDLSTIRSGASKGATAYQKPTSGIPASDLASGVIPSVPTALSQLSGDSTHRVVTDAEKSTWNGKQNAISDLATIRSGAALGATALQSVPSGYATEQYVDNHHDNTKQDVISDLATIRSGAALGATAVQPEAGKGLFSGNYNDLANKPTIPSAVTESTVSGWGFTKNTGTYSKPSGGIPKTDLASAVQTSLGKADTALQEHQDISGKQDIISDLSAIRSNASAGAAKVSCTDAQVGSYGYIKLSDLPIYDGGVS